MRASEFMTTAVVTMTPDTPIKQAAATLADIDIASAPVLDANGRLVGMVSEMDLLRSDVPPDPLAHIVRSPDDESAPPRTVADVMTRDVIALPAGADAATFVNHFLTSGVRCIPVLGDGDTVVGVVARRDILRLLARSDEEIRADVVAKLRDALPDQPGWQAHLVEGVANLTADPRADDEAREVARRVAQSVAGVIRAHVVE